MRRRGHPCLNPSFRGWSLGLGEAGVIILICQVLILLFVDGHSDLRIGRYGRIIAVLILLFVDGHSDEIIFLPQTESGVLILLFVDGHSDQASPPAG